MFLSHNIINLPIKWRGPQYISRLGLPDPVSMGLSGSEITHRLYEHFHEDLVFDMRGKNAQISGAIGASVKSASFATSFVLDRHDYTLVLCGREVLTAADVSSSNLLLEREP